MLTDWEMDISNIESGATGKARSVQFVTVDDKVVWAVTCVPGSTPDQGSLQMCDSIVRSFRLLQ